MSSAVIFPAHPEKVLKGLSSLWTSLAQEEKQQGKPTVLRACAMTLIVASDEPDKGFAASQTISDLMRSHPSRGIVIYISHEAEHDLEARVLAQCWKPFGKAQQICCEQIEIAARPESWPNVGRTLVGLTVADLPVIFWCRHSAALRSDASADEKAGLDAVLELSTKVIIDTSDYEPASAFELIHRLGTSDRIVADLEWTRLTPWRQPIAQIFDNPARTNTFSQFHALEITHGGEQPSPGLLYLAGWFSQTHPMEVRWRAGVEFGRGLHSIRLISDDEEIVSERLGGECVRIRTTSGPARTYNVPEASDHLLLEEELSLLGRDPVFERTFRRAQELLIGI
jgi:glucose-6-phosphate dehydrogenase assembly protein OpcA